MATQSERQGQGIFPVGTAAPITVDRQRYVILRTALAHASNPTTFVNPFSPQSLALKWLAYQDQIIDVIFLGENVTNLDASFLVENNEYQWKLEQRFALLVLYFSTNGHAWRGITPWEYHVDTDECSVGFQGVGCDPMTGQVLQISLSNRLVDGHLPEEIGETRTVSFVQSVLEAGSSRTLILLAPLGLLTQLTLLDFSRNLMQGRLPHSLYHQLTKLRKCWVLVSVNCS